MTKFSTVKQSTHERELPQNKCGTISKMFFIFGGAKTGLAVVMCLSWVCLHIPLSLLLFCYFSHAAGTQITTHGFSFQLIFPKWDQKWVFSLLPGGTLAGAAEDLKRWQPRCVFSGQGDRKSVV